MRSLLFGGLALGVTACSPSPSLAASHAISGHIAQTGGVTVVIALSGARASTTSTDATGNYRFAELPDGVYELTPTQAGNSFSPGTRSVTVAGADVSAQDFTGTLTACIADSSQALLRCAAAVQAGTFTTIEVQGGLVCTGVAACRVKITDVPVTIVGAPGSFIRRIDHHDYALFQFIANPAVTLQDLTIDEDVDVPCVPVTPANPPVANPLCASTVDVYGAESTILDHVTIAWAKAASAVLAAGGDVHVVHSRFIGSHLFGLQIGALTGSLLVEDSAFEQMSSNAMVLSDVHGTSTTPLRISRTLFEHNHRDDVYFVCGPAANEQCSGGQLLLYGNVDFLRVEDTVIRIGGEIGPPAGGVELNSHMHDISFAHADIHTNGMPGAYLNPNPVDVARVSFIDDELYDNGTALYYQGVDIGNFPPGIVTETGSCHTAGCNPVSIGVLWGLPGGSFAWATNDLADPKVTLDGVLLSNSPDGQGTADAGSVIVLFDGSLELDRVVTR